MLNVHIPRPKRGRLTTDSYCFTCMRADCVAVWSWSAFWNFLSAFSYSLSAFSALDCHFAIWFSACLAAFLLPASSSDNSLFSFFSLLISSCEIALWDVIDYRPWRACNLLQMFTRSAPDKSPQGDCKSAFCTINGPPTMEDWGKTHVHNWMKFRSVTFNLDPCDLWASISFWKSTSFLEVLWSSESFSLASSLSDRAACNQIMLVRPPSLWALLEACSIPTWNISYCRVLQACLVLLNMLQCILLLLARISSALSGRLAAGHYLSITDTWTAEKNFLWKLKTCLQLFCCFG